MFNLTVVVAMMVVAMDVDVMKNIVLNQGESALNVVSGLGLGLLR